MASRGAKGPWIRTPAGWDAHWFDAAERGDMGALREAMTQGVDPATVKGHGRSSALHIAAERGHADAVAFMAAWCPLSIRDGFDMFAMGLAAREGHLKTVEALLARHGRRRGPQVAEALMHAAGAGRREVAARLAAHPCAMLGWRDADGWSLPMRAARSGDAGMIRLALKWDPKGASVDVGGNDMFICAARSGSAEAMELAAAACPGLDKERRLPRAMAAVAASGSPEAIAWAVEKLGADFAGPQAQPGALHAVARSKHPRAGEAIAILAGMGMDLEARDDLFGQTSLHKAAAQEDGSGLPALLSLLALGADSLSRGPSGATPLMQAACKGTPEAVQALLAHPGKDAADSEGLTALHLAADSARSLEVLALLADPLSAAAKDAGGATPLMMAVEAGWLEGARELARHGSIDARDYRGRTALILAAESGCEESGALLLAAGADPALADKRGSTALMMACESGSSKLAGRLARMGGVDAKDKAGRSAWHRALAGPQPAACVEALLAQAKGGAAISAWRSSAGETILHWAAALDSSEGFVAGLLAAAPIDARDHDGSTALMLAAEDGSSAKVAQLLAAGADPDLQDQDGSTALMRAVDAGEKECVEALAWASDFAIRDERGRSAMDRGGHAPWSSAAGFGSRGEFCEWLAAIALARAERDALGEEFGPRSEAPPSPSAKRI